MASRLEWLLGIVIFIAVFGLVLAYFMPKEQPSGNNYKFKALEDGVLFCSNEKEPSEFMLSLKDKNDFVIVISHHAENSNLTFSGNTLVTLASVLKASGKNTTLLVREYNSSKLQYCETNYGLPDLDKQITPQECEEILNSDSNFGKAILFVENPDSSLKQNEVFLEKNTVFLKPKASSEMQKIALTVLKVMYSDSEDKIRIINDYFASIQG